MVFGMEEIEETYFSGDYESVDVMRSAVKASADAWIAKWYNVDILRRPDDWRGEPGTVTGLSRGSTYRLRAFATADRCTHCGLREAVRITYSKPPAGPRERGTQKRWLRD